MYMNPYNNKYIFHPLLKEEILQIDKVWIFIDKFQVDFLTRNMYVENIISNISKLYTITDFFIYEVILEKLYWNLFNFIIDKVHISDTIKEKHTDKSKIIQKILYNSLIKMTSLRKAYIYNKHHHNYMYKYHYPNDIDMLLFSIIKNRSTYETILSNPDLSLYEINELITEPYNSIVEFDYPFPNFNTIKPFVYSSKERIKNIKKFYYVTNAKQNWNILK